jgi:glycosyl transferase family 1/glycosyl transferase family 4
MKILFVATKPPWPTVDGGRLLLWHTLAALAERGADLTLVAPADRDLDAENAAAKLNSICRTFLRSRSEPTRLKNFAFDLFPGVLRGIPVSIIRHRVASVSNQVRDLLSREAFDLVHAEQVQAIANCSATENARVPVVLRAQNVESDLWRMLALHRPAFSLILKREARLLSEWEAGVVRRSQATIAITTNDAARLAALTGCAARVHHIPAPFPDLPPSVSTLPGSPPLVLFGNSGWIPNRDGARWFISEIWPAVVARSPSAVLHVFASIAAKSSPGLVMHQPPAESAEVFAPSSILVVPLRIASGVRIKILEAWARGIPVVATPEAAAGLDAIDGAELIVARGGDGFASAIAKLAVDADLRGKIIDRARTKLRASHDPATVARRLHDLYERVVDAARKPYSSATDGPRNTR